MSTEVSLAEIAFDGGSVEVAQLPNGDLMIPVKPAAQKLGIDWPSQLKRIRRSTEMSDASRLLMVRTVVGLREMTCLPLPMFIAWLFSVDKARCGKAVRGTSLSEYATGMFGAVRNYEAALKGISDVFGTPRRTYALSEE